METNTRTQQTPARTYESFSQETRQAIRNINMGIGGRYRILEDSIVDYYNPSEGTWHFLRYLTPEEIAFREFLTNGGE